MELLKNTKTRREDSQWIEQSEESARGYGCLKFRLIVYGDVRDHAAFNGESNL